MERGDGSPPTPLDASFILPKAVRGILVRNNLLQVFYLHCLTVDCL